MSHPKKQHRGKPDKRGSSRNQVSKPSPALQLHTSDRNLVFGHNDTVYYFNESRLTLLIGQIFDHVSEAFAKRWYSAVAGSSLGVCLPCVIALFTTEFKPVFYFSAAEIRIGFLLVAVLSLISAVCFGFVTLYRWLRFKKSRSRDAVVSWGFTMATQNCTDERQFDSSYNPPSREL